MTVPDPKTRSRGARGRRTLPLVALAASMLCLPATAQTVTAPGPDSATLRARLKPAMAPDGRPMPADAAALDAMLKAQAFGPLVARLNGAKTASDVFLDMNWEQARIYDGAGFVVSYAYMNDLWRIGTSLPEPKGDELKQSAAMMLLYGLDLVALDGVKCGDRTAPGHRRDQLFGQNAPILAYLRSLPVERRMVIGAISLDIEAATAPVRTNDVVLCSGGIDEMSAGLKAQGTRPLAEVPSPPGIVGKTYAVPPPPGYAPTFVAEAQWRPQQLAIRQSMPAALRRMLGDPATTPAAPPK